MQTLYGGKNPHSTFRIVPLQKNAIRTINNQPRNSHSSLLLFKKSILKFDQSLKSLTQIKLKLFLLKDALTNTHNDPLLICGKLF